MKGKDKSYRKNLLYNRGKGSLLTQALREALNAYIAQKNKLKACLLVCWGLYISGSEPMECSDSYRAISEYMSQYKSEGVNGML